MRPVHGSDTVSIRLSVTDRCQMRCLYCMPREGVSTVAKAEVLSFEEMAAFVRAVRSSFPVSKVHITGGEPLVREGVVRLTAMLSAQDVGQLALTTNGQLLSRYARPLRAAGLTRVNVSLDSLVGETYRRLTRGGTLERTLEGIHTALECGLTPVKLNVTVLRGINLPELADIARFALRTGCTVRFLELMPIGPATERHSEWFVPAYEVRTALQAEFELEPIGEEAGGSTRQFRMTDRAGNSGTVGFISSLTAPFCKGCSRIRLTSTGQLIGCLAMGSGRDIRELLREDGAENRRRLLECVGKALAAKRNGRRFVTTRPMVEVGG